jgi:hypothetical protein
MTSFDPASYNNDHLLITDAAKALIQKSGCKAMLQRITTHVKEGEAIVCYNKLDVVPDPYSILVPPGLKNTFTKLLSLDIVEIENKVASAHELAALVGDANKKTTSTTCNIANFALGLFFENSLGNDCKYEDKGVRDRRDID